MPHRQKEAESDGDSVASEGSQDAQQPTQHTSQPLHLISMGTYMKDRQVSEAVVNELLSGIWLGLHDAIDMEEAAAGKQLDVLVRLAVQRGFSM